jgi:hypothetical protein
VAPPYHHADPGADVRHRQFTAKLVDALHLDARQQGLLAAYIARTSQTISEVHERDVRLATFTLIRTGDAGPLRRAWRATTEDMIPAEEILAFVVALDHTQRGELVKQAFLRW